MIHFFLLNSIFGIPWIFKKIHTITINVHVVNMARYVMVLRRAISLLRALEGVGPENRDFFGP